MQHIVSSTLDAAVGPYEAIPWPACPLISMTATHPHTVRCSRSLHFLLPLATMVSSFSYPLKCRFPVLCPVGSREAHLFSLGAETSSGRF